MDRWRLRDKFIPLVFAWGWVIPAWAGSPTGLTPITVLSANFAIGSQNDLIMEFQVTGPANGPDTITDFGLDNNIVTQAAANGTPPDIANVKLWFHSGPNPFSPGFSSPVVIPATSHYTWSGSTLGLAVTNAAYLFVTVDLATTATAGDNFNVL